MSSVIETSMVSVTVHSSDQDLLSQQNDMKEKGYKGNIIVYSMTDCPSCAKAKLVLCEACVPFIDIRLDLYPTEKYNISSVPAIYFNEVFVGGLKELLELINDKDRFQEMILKVKNNYPAPWAPVLPNLHKKPSVEIYSPRLSCGEVSNNYFKLEKLLRQAGIIGTHRRCLKKYENSFLTNELMEYSWENGLDGKTLGQTLLDHRTGRWYTPSEKFDVKKQRLYVLYDSHYTKALNWVEVTNMTKKDSIIEVNEHIRIYLLKLYAKHVSKDGKVVDYKNMENSIEFRQFKTAMGTLIYISVEEMSRSMKIAFFINIFNALVIHGHIVQGFPLNWLQRRLFFRKCRYIIARQLYSLNDILNGILRGNTTGSDNFRKPFSNNDPRKKAALEKPEPLIHFALVYGTKSSPQLRIYSPECVEEQLFLAAANYLHQGGCMYDMDSRNIQLSPIFKKYYSDFGCSSRHQTLGVVINFMADDKHRCNIEEMYKSGDYTLEFMDDDNSLNCKVDTDMFQ